jgi:hypothetical protein
MLITSVTNFAHRSAISFEPRDDDDRECAWTFLRAVGVARRGLRGAGVKAEARRTAGRSGAQSLDAGEHRPTFSAVGDRLELVARLEPPTTIAVPVRT